MRSSLVDLAGLDLHMRSSLVDYFPFDFLRTAYLFPEPAGWPPPDEDLPPRAFCFCFLAPADDWSPPHVKQLNLQHRHIFLDEKCNVE
ncbi:hypothetical protein SLEP1_g4482 [Rubroshorea leprosula]|uniref:Uncharacterized protein n=1 Tax=Rubroshorea leprosula TaxID=152421 RepID=A0AAV5HYC7_9ROSI|nr:hypothetical protein SLEP1_g4482 [Rubroshorea leprosula]